MRYCGIIPLLLVGLVAAPLWAQDRSGGIGSGVAGGFLGAYTGAVAGGLLGDVLCGEDPVADGCWKRVVLGGGGLGAVSGVWLGLTDRDRVRGAGLGAGLGAVAGAMTWTVLDAVGIRRSDSGPAWLEGALVVGAIGAVVGGVVSGGEGKERGSGERGVVVHLSVPVW